MTRRNGGQPTGRLQLVDEQLASACWAGRRQGPRTARAGRVTIPGHNKAVPERALSEEISEILGCEEHFGRPSSGTHPGASEHDLTLTGNIPAHIDSATA
jgi:hypothetical protein